MAGAGYGSQGKLWLWGSSEREQQKTAQYHRELSPNAPPPLAPTASSRHHLPRPALQCGLKQQWHESQTGPEMVTKVCAPLVLPTQTKWGPETQLSQVWRCGARSRAAVHRYWALSGAIIYMRFCNHLAPSSGHENKLQASDSQQTLTQC